MFQNSLYFLNKIFFLPECVNVLQSHPPQKKKSSVIFLHVQKLVKYYLNVRLPPSSL